LKSILKNITVAFLLIVISISTMGFSVNTLYCFCMNQYEASLFNIEHTCKNAVSHEDDEALKEMPPCCKKAMACAKEKQHAESGCTKKEKKFFKANLKYLEIKKPELVDIQWVKTDVRCLMCDVRTLYTSYIVHQTSYINYRPPPQYFGRHLLNFIQVYRC
jgi:hypothetical protein